MILDMPNHLDGWSLTAHTETPRVEEGVETGGWDVNIVYMTSAGEKATLRFYISKGGEKLALSLTEKAIANVRRTIEAIQAARNIQPCDPCPERERKTQKGVSNGKA